MMMENHGRFARTAGPGWIPLVLLIAGLAGCAHRHAGPGLLGNAKLGALTIAVAPAINDSGTTEFDPEHFADEMANELGYVDGINVVPVSRVVDAMRQQGWEDVGSADEAMKLARLVGADAILVFAVTSYNPYDPPRIGLSAQLIGHRPEEARRVDPLALARSAASRETPRQNGRDGVLAQASRVFDASHEDVTSDLRVYAAQRNAGDNPYGYRWYVISQRRFMQYCCNATIRLLLAGEAEGTATKRELDETREEPARRSVASR